MSKKQDNQFLTPTKERINLTQSLTSTKSNRSERHYEVLKMISNDSLSDSIKFGSRYIQKSLSNISDDCILEDRFIPSRRLIQDFDIEDCDEYTFNDENEGNCDPQALTVAEIYSEQILGRTSVKNQNLCQKQIMKSFKNKNLLKFKVASNVLKPFDQCKFYPSLNEIKSPLKVKGRKIQKNPCKILDAPALADDFYLNLVHWSQRNLLAVGLSNSIYLWNPETSKVTRLFQQPDDTISSLAWGISNENILAVGCNKGHVLIWDVEKQKQIKKLEGHQMRVGCLAWNRKLLSSGSRDKTILQRDIRCSKKYVQKFAEHSQQICGLKWSHDDQYLASGGNDNRAIVWNQNGNVINKFTDHKAAVKALAWSPHIHGLLATGGGTADRMLKMRNAITGEILCSKDTGSQVCNLQFSKSLHEVVSTHGYSQNEINIWSYPNMKKVGSLRGHTHRVLYLSMSPDGSTIVTGAGDETLRFWNIFPSCEVQKDKYESQLQNQYQFR